MLRYILKRCLEAVPTLLGVSLITFLLVRVSGDPARFVLGELATPEALAAFRTQHGLDQPLYIQFFRYMTGVLQGDLGKSVRYNQSVTELFMERVPATVELGLTAYAIAILIGVTAGVVAGVYAGSLLDKSIRLLSFAGQAAPSFYLGLLLIILVSVQWKLVPTGGRGTLAHLILPAITLSANLIALITRFTRSAILDVLKQDYVRTARAKGLSGSVVVVKHALRNAMIPLLTVLALQSSVLFSGAVVTETVFSWPGIGRLAVNAINTRDYPIVQGTVLIVTMVVVVINLVVDLSYAVLDPTIKYS